MEGPHTPRQRHRFLDSDVPEPEGPQFAALGHSGSLSYKGLETFPNPGCAVVILAFDELMSSCPVTGQPDFYVGKIQLRGTTNLVESKSLKLFFHSIIKFHTGLFGESLAVYIRDCLCEALEADVDEVTVELTQKSRGGISITAVA